MFPELFVAAIGVVLIPLLTIVAVQALSHDPRPSRRRFR